MKCMMIHVPRRTNLVAACLSAFDWFRKASSYALNAGKTSASWEPAPPDHAPLGFVFPIKVDFATHRVSMSVAVPATNDTLIEHNPCWNEMNDKQHVWMINNMPQTDRQTDRQTDIQTDKLSITRVPLGRSLSSSVTRSFCAGGNTSKSMSWRNTKSALGAESSSLLNITTTDPHRTTRRLVQHRFNNNHSVSCSTITLNQTHFIVTHLFIQWSARRMTWWNYHEGTTFNLQLGGNQELCRKGGFPITLGGGWLDAGFRV